MLDRLAIILLNYRGLTDTLECLESLRAADLGAARVILLDNDSGAADVEGLRRWNEDTSFFERLVELKEEEPTSAARVNTLLFNDVNTGFAGGNNLATSYALAGGDEEVLLLNNDTIVQPEFLQKLARARRRYPDAVLSPQIRLYAQPDYIWNCGGALLWPGRKRYYFENQHRRRAPAGEDTSIEFVTGCALMYRPKRTGLLTETFFFGEEDMEFSRRLREKKIPVWCVNGSIIYHKVGSSIPASPRKSEIFVLKRLVNLRLHASGAEAAAGFVYHGANLLRLLRYRYGLPLISAVQRTKTVLRLARRLERVGKDYCVDYPAGTMALSAINNPR